MKTSLPLITFILAAAIVSAEEKKQHRTSTAPFLKPAEAVAKMDIPDGFEVSIFAAEPDLGEPIAFTFDGRGRIWVVENYNYINRGSHHQKTELSRIQIMEDTNGDGVFDTKKLFTDKITFSSGIAVGFGGVYLGTPPNLVFIPDANGDDVPDGKPEILLDGWGIDDRHETLNSFIWGPDGWLYGCHGVFTRSLVGKPGTPNKDRQYIDAGIWRFHPVRKDFEIFASGLSNPWGFDFNDLGHGFATCCVIPHLFHVVQNGVYHKQSKPHVNPYVFDDIKTIRDHTHLSAHGGARFYLADTFPKVFHNHLFMCNIHQHEILTDFMVPKASGYIGKHGYDFLDTNDLAWVGFSVEIGPEGGVYILDWHDTDICGNAINFPNSGRIYRIMPKGVKPTDRPDIYGLSDLDLVALQAHANDWYVRQARVELHHRAVAGKLDQKTVHAKLDEYFNNAPTSGKRLRALWANHVTGRFAGGEIARLVELLSHEDEHIRAWTVQLLSENNQVSETIRSEFLQMADRDSSAVVRLYLASALHRLPIDQRWEILAALARRGEDVSDPNIPRVLWLALEPAVTSFPEKALEVAMAGRIPFLQESVARRMVSGGSSDATSTQWPQIINQMAPGFVVEDVGEGGVVALTSFRNQKAVQTHPKDRNTPCRLKRRLEIPPGKKTTLKIRASYHPHGDWQLRVWAGRMPAPDGGKARLLIADQIVSYQTVKEEWLNIEVDLTQFAGTTIDLSIENRANDWKNEFGYWGGISIVSE